MLYLMVLGTDVWSPSCINSTLGFGYSVTFIDNFSECTRVSVIKERSEFFTIFQCFCNEFELTLGILFVSCAVTNKIVFSSSFQ
jgi:hypothetical protein